MQYYSATVAQMNDEFRQSGEGVILTPGVLGLSNRAGLLWIVHNFNRWPAIDDRSGEHNFGHFTWNDKIVMWKINYLDNGKECLQNQLLHDCQRSLTIMLGSEY
jgi:hypothetical protein